LGDFIWGIGVSKKKLTLTISGNVLARAKEKAKNLGLSLSRIVENALDYFSEPKVYCFSCGFRFSAGEADICPRCGWYKCPSCGACACVLGEEGVRVAFYMRKTLMEIFSSSDV